MTCPLCGDRMAHDAYGAHLRTDHPELTEPSFIDFDPRRD